MTLNAIIATVSLVIQLKAGIPVGSATGFFYTRNDVIFFVTNQHVFRDDKNGIIPDAIRLRLHTDSKNVDKSADFDVPLYNGNQRLWKIHPQHQDADVAVIMLDKIKLQPKFFIKAWSSQNFLPSQYRLDPGEDIFIMGYPQGFHDIKNNLPIFRNAMVASVYPIYFQGIPFFLTDANLHPGTSGSPVITKPKNMWIDNKGNTQVVTGTIYYLLGVHSGTIDSEITGGQQIGLGAAWYAQLIEDIAAQF